MGLVLALNGLDLCGLNGLVFWGVPRLGPACPAGRAGRGRAGPAGWVAVATSIIDILPEPEGQPQDWPGPGDDHHASLGRIWGRQTAGLGQAGRARPAGPGCPGGQTGQPWPGRLAIFLMVGLAGYSTLKIFSGRVSPCAWLIIAWALIFVLGMQLTSKMPTAAHIALLPL